MSTEEMIKQAFEKQAGEAGDHRRVLAEVARVTGTRRRIGAAGIALLATGVVAAVVMPVVLFTGGGEPVPVEPALSAPPVLPPGTPVLKYVPGWLPDEMVEDLREVRQDGSLVRGWSVPGTGTGPENGGGQEIELQFSQSAKLTDPEAYGAQAVDINGNHGLVSGSEGAQPGQSIVEWLVGTEGKLTLRVDRVPDAKSLALSIARSVRADSDASFIRPITFGWLPAGVTPGAYSVRGTSKPYLVAETLIGEPFKGPFAVFVEIGPDKPTGSGTPVTVRGTEGVYNDQAGHGMKGEIWAPVEGGRWLKVSGSLGKEDLVRVTDGLTLLRDPKFPWLGR